MPSLPDRERRTAPRFRGRAAGASGRKYSKILCTSIPFRAPCKNEAYNAPQDAAKSKLSLPVLELGDESVGQRIARIRKERGYTQNELAERIGTIQALVSDYERDKLRLNADMAVRFAIALEVTTDELLGLHSANGRGKKQAKSNARKASRKVLRRLEQIQDLPINQQAVLLKTIDTFIKAATK